MSQKMQAIDPAERNSIMKLKGELNDSKLNHKVEWLYTGDKLDRDAYLLGKPIDKILIEKELEKPKGNIFANTVDLANKIREDPLFEIKKQEIEAKKRLLSNPIRINQIKEMINKSENRVVPTNQRNSSSSDSDLSGQRRHHHHRKHKNKKKSKKQHRRSESHDSDKETSETESKRKYHKKRHSSRSRTRSRSRNRSRSPQMNRNRSRSPQMSRNRSRSPQISKNDRYKSSIGNHHVSSTSNQYGLIKRERDETSSRNEVEKRDASKKSQSQIEIEEYKRKIEKLNQIRKSKNGASGGGGNDDADKRNASSNVRAKLTEEEKQKRLAEMQDNAKWRNDIRNKNVSKYKQDDKKEEELQQNNNAKHYQKEAAHNFNNLMRDAYSSTEDRIRRNIKNIQRNESALDRNFARK